MFGDSFKGQTVIVTGGAAGIGRGICRCFAEMGANLVIADWNDRHGEAAQAEFAAMGVDAMFVKTDVSSPEDIERVVAKTMDRWGRIDTLVNNVGTHYYRPMQEISVADWDRVIATDLRGHFLMSRAVIPHMIKRRSGSIVHISSVHSQQTSTRHTVYAAAKGGIVSMARGMALELAPYGIRVNVVLPGYTRSSQMDEALANMAPEEREPYMRRCAVNVPLGRVADPEEIGWAVVFLASSRASFITGSCLTADGGETAHLQW